MLYYFLFIYIIFIVIYLLKNNYIDASKLIKMYMKSKTEVYVVAAGGLGNRLLSFIGIILISVYFKSKPFRMKDILNL